MTHPLTIARTTDTTPDGTLALYCGRGSPLGNPHVMRNPSKKERDRVCDLYEKDFPNEDQLAECRWIAVRLSVQPVALTCFCTPKRCHCETVKRYIEIELYQV